MEFEEFLEQRRHGTVRAGIENSDAVRLIDLLPRRYQRAHYFWALTWFLSIPGFIAVSFIYKWWVGILLLLFITPAIRQATMKSAAQFMLEHIEHDRILFESLRDSGVLILQPVGAGSTGGNSE